MRAHTRMQPLPSICQAPVVTLSSNVSAGLKGGLSQAKALLNKAASAVGEAAAKTAAASGGGGGGSTGTAGSPRFSQRAAGGSGLQ